MSELEDFELDSQDTEGRILLPPPKNRGMLGLVVVGLLLVVALLVAGLVTYHRPPAPKPAPSAKPVETEAPEAVASPTPTPPPTLPASLPKLDASDAFVRQLAGPLSDDRLVAGWLTRSGLVRLFTVVVDNVAGGASPRPHLDFLAPKDGFKVVEKKGRILADPRSFERYDAFSKAVASLDGPGCARAFEKLSPLFEAAYRDLGHPEGGFKAAFTGGIQALLDAPVADADVPLRRVVHGVILYEYADARLERLTPAQKHMLRMGPRNVRLIQGKLREVLAALSPS